jgi:transcriptional regulator with XRE-family HTH domain
MNGGTLVREARRRAGITQAELAGRVGTTQSAIARVERSRSDPSFERVGELVEACGLELRWALTSPDDSTWSVAIANLALDVDSRVRQNERAVRFARGGREAMQRARA